ncbi:uncharacterized protein TM35_002991000 [Trypanosoma theileri]|uniref:Uncharacterized protein n=1 Tax=Trypanosoma theileri TaxID=67003 RepID=A0A1X0NCT7_9TRYP|nr:uncharacterized protein TM35_002991000 [Trypanosoma theileri]ORC76552.1 hypothetical protein TM35_002991000 [Trypanosoma theileri]
MNKNGTVFGGGGTKSTAATTIKETPQIDPKTSQQENVPDEVKLVKALETFHFPVEEEDAKETKNSKESKVNDVNRQEKPSSILVADNSSINNHSSNNDNAENNNNKWGGSTETGKGTAQRKSLVKFLSPNPSKGSR